MPNGRFKTVFCMIFAWNNLEICFQLTSAESTPKLKIVENIVLKMNEFYSKVEKI